MVPDADRTAPLLIRIDHDPVIDGVTVRERNAVRAVIRRGDLLLMVHSTVGGDVKFPGGGFEPGESAYQALIREVSEECGRTVTHVGDAVIRAIEHRRADEPGALFRMESTYYPCDVTDEMHPQRLDDYERELGFEPVWIGIDAAIAANDAVLSAGTAHTWVTRETRVLRALRSWS